MAQYDCLLLDLDDTLYPKNSGLEREYYMVEKLGIEEDKAVGYDFDYDDFHSYIFTNADKVHAVKALTKLGLEDCFEGVICFETLNPTHKNTVSGDEDIEFLGSAATATYVHTSPQIFDMMDQFAHHNQGATLPKTPILFSDDSVRNIQAGKHVGLHTVLIGTSQRPKGADYALESIHKIKQALSELWEIGTKSVVSYPGQVTVEKSVTA
ncbi:hypothetical protein E1A91_A13G114500v1 [Gossypium mustelinum]|uniref:Uncharacterized protein n=1 Tax=Gossypium mustelinum TaxID=34275 RepID=A0A5D2WH52_GOSMU|nr:hypothetical protein E1A91_A13G114500v1 [Gossypium mustelinum]